MERLSPIEEARLKSRRYNTVKMRTTLTKVDARLTWVFLAWLFFVGITSVFYAWSPSSQQRSVRGPCCRYTLAMSGISRKVRQWFLIRNSLRIPEPAIGRISEFSCYIAPW